MFDALFVLAVPVLWVVCFLRPGVACGLSLSGFALEQCAQGFVPLLGAHEELFNYLVASCVIVALIRQLIRRGPLILWPGPSGWATTVLLAYTALTLGWTLFPSSTEASLLLKLPFVGLFVFMAPHTVQTERDVEDLFIVTIFGAATALAVLILFVPWEGRSVYIASTGQVTNPLALTQAAGNVLIGGALTPVVRHKAGRAFVPVATALALIVLVIFVRTQSRGQIVAAIGVTTVLVAFVRRGRFWLVVGAIGVIWIMASGLFDDEIASSAVRWDRRQMAKDVGDDRVGQAQQLMEYWYAASPFHQIFGLGHAAAQDPRLLGTYPHVVPIEVLAEEGLVGAGLYLLALTVGARAYIRGILSPHESTRAFLPALFGLFCYEFILTLKQGTLTGNTFFLLLLVLADSVGRSIARHPKLVPEPAPLSAGMPLATPPG